MPTHDERSLEVIRQHLLESAELKCQTLEKCSGAILDAAKIISEAFRSDAKVLLCGNGGSAADWQHMAAELVSLLSKDLQRPGLPAIALTTDTSFLTAYSNDSGFEGVFERQVQALGRPGDILIGISTSAASMIVIRAVKYARKADMRTVALTGEAGPLSRLADVAVSVPSYNTQYIQECHLAIEHIICEYVECELFGENKGLENS